MPMRTTKEARKSTAAERTVEREMTSREKKTLLHLALGSRESYQNCLDFIRDMVRLGLRAPVLVTTDGAPGLIRAVTEVWGRSLRQRCLAHRMRNILEKLPRDGSRTSIPGPSRLPRDLSSGNEKLQRRPRSPLCGDRTPR